MYKIQNAIRDINEVIREKDEIIIYTQVYLTMVIDYLKENNIEFALKNAQKGYDYIEKHYKKGNF